MNNQNVAYVRYLENDDINYLSRISNTSKRDLLDHLVEQKELFSKDQFYIACNGENNPVGAAVFKNIDYKNKHLILVCSPVERGLIIKFSKYAFNQFDINKVIVFADQSLDGMPKAGTLRMGKKEVTVYEIRRENLND